MSQQSPKGAYEVSVHYGAIATTASKLAVDLYMPCGLEVSPVVVIAHGFSRSRKNMAGLARLVASHGFIAAVPELPGWTDYRRNARELAALLEGLRSDGLLRQPKPAPRSALIGYSMGGLSALLAAANTSDVHCWIGLDPVDMDESGKEAATNLRIPSVVLCAEPGPWNHGSRQIVRALSGPRFALRVKDATHSDPEHPGDWLTQMFCGKAHPARRRIFEDYAIAALRALFFEHPASLASLKAAKNDQRVSDVILEKIHAFSPSLMMQFRWRNIWRSAGFAANE